MLNPPIKVREALGLLDLHFESFYQLKPFADDTGHPVPMDTRGWSQILVSKLSGVRGIDRRKGPDLKDGSDVKGANTWEAIDRPRFNGVIKDGTQSVTSGLMASLDLMPHLYLVLWDTKRDDCWRCRIWVVRPRADEEFREVCRSWYKMRRDGKIGSSNFQLHPPYGSDDDILRNKCGNLHYPLYFSAERQKGARYRLCRYSPKVLSRGNCRKVAD